LTSLLTPPAAFVPAPRTPPAFGQNGHIGQNGPIAPSGGRPANNCVRSVHSVHDSERSGRSEEAGAPPHRLVSDPVLLPSVVAAIDSTALIGLDLETTGLDPRTDRVRLLSLSCDTIAGGRFTYLVDCFAVDPAPLWEVLAGKELAIHNAAFDLAFLA